MGGVKTIQWGENGPTYTCGAPEEESKEEEETLEDCECGLNAVQGEEKFQSGSVDGDKMCQFGSNCATFFEGCADKGAKVCSLKIMYRPIDPTEPAVVPTVEALQDCTCGLNTVEGEPNYEAGSSDGDKMCQFGSNCATFFDGCADKGATVCSLKITYATQAPPVPTEAPESEESEESEEPEVTCSKADCIKPCKGKRRKPKMCQVRK